jgi:Tol biopolymer transport system component
MHPDGSRKERIGGWGGRDRIRDNPTWSPDGRIIAFAERGDIHAINRRSGRVGLLVEGISGVLPSWSWNEKGFIISLPHGRPAPRPGRAPAGFRVRASALPPDPISGSGGTRIVEIDPGSGSAEQLLFAPGGTAEPELSPNGSALAYQSTRGIPQIHVFEDGRKRRLTDLPGGAVEPTWSPDGSQIAFVAAFRRGEVARDTDIFVVDVEGGEPRRLGGTPGQDRRPDWSPDGTRVVFDAEAAIWTVGVFDREFIRLTSTHDITQRHGFPVDPTWSPDGQWIAITRFAPSSINGIRPSAHLWLLSSDGTVERRTDRRLEGWMDWQLEPTWAPDGRSLAFIDYDSPSQGDVDGDPRVRLAVVDVRTRDVVLHRMVESMTGLSWGPGGIVASMGTGALPDPTFLHDFDPWFEE